MSALALSWREPIGLTHLSYILAVVSCGNEAPADGHFRICFPVFQGFLFPVRVELERFRTLAFVVADVWVGIFPMLKFSLQILLAFDFAFNSNDKRLDGGCGPFLVAFMLHEREDADLIPRPCL